MIGTLIISIATILSIIASSLFKPSVKIFKMNVSLYWCFAVLGAILLLVFGYVDPSLAFSRMVSSQAMNPIKILILFISMTIISISLDELGFFEYIARVVLNKTKSNQLSIFLSIYFLVAFLTVFTSNDIVILTLTPFIITFSKEAKINPIPYLVSEFFSANTWSMFLLIGNPTNIYLTQSFNIEFFEYIKVMAIPTLVTGVVELLLLLVLFRKDLKVPLTKENREAKLENKSLVIVNLVILVITTILLSISSYLSLEMYLISLIMMILLMIISAVIHIVKHDKTYEVEHVILRTPYELIPFVLSMFIIVLSLEKAGITLSIANILSQGDTTYTFGFTSFLSANLFNNIPMTILYSSMLEPLSGVQLLRGAYASIIGSNLGAIFTPLGALAGIMWMNILKRHDIKFGFLKFVKYGVIVSIPLIVVALVMLGVIL